MALAAALLAAPAASAQEQDTESRLDALEAENAELRARIDAVAGQLEQVEFRDIMPAVGESRFGMGPAASKVYARDQGLSIGGYGEVIYTSYAGDKTTTFDNLRAVLYTGYKFDERWVFNSEIEFEHASTDKAGSASVEFAYLEYLHADALNVRAGLLLVPMGHVNEMHEPTTFYGPSRPETELRIIPSTWRENGAGLHGDLGPFNYKLYVMAGLDASGFDESGLRGGRQKGSKSKAEDLAFVGRLDWVATRGLLAGVSGYSGDSGQGDPNLGDVGTTILDAHLEYKWRGLRLRALYVQADIGDTDKINTGSGTVVGEEMSGWYLEAGYDLMSVLRPESVQSLVPYARYEELDTHASVAPGLGADPAQDETIATLGLDWFPIDSIVFKAAYQDFDQGTDRFQLSLGYVF